MNVLVTGPEGSGTHMLAAIVRGYLGIEPIDRSLPYAGTWWANPVPAGLDRPRTYFDPATGEPFPSDTRTVVIVRRPDVTQLALLGRKPPLAADIVQARSQWERALAALAAMPGACWLTYEAVVTAPRTQADNLAAWLGVEPVGSMPEVRDENRKWLSFLEARP